ncbi:RsmB/NOP family class I SAM-dependent RNA methyltransferase [Methylovirgula sp. 4M-Z18]|uniref:RsmB/NOP family class I SAM-dependent RNA methyltransferase n=1 Tax=Methylovirgula sp. 4M-Z18 TaxID=2293567 RepID=UPI000E2F79A3|nr:RsmB/NOP family class I SAM-dependent RNA methyltransferase [Methylovirgula sp. 4M-Z18]RFB78218.1 methyltransferase domain-containing protein [Methylovirgula sp. 4M-Z18]
MTPHFRSKTSAHAPDNAPAPGLAARQAAAAILADVLGGGRSLDDSFTGASPNPALKDLDARDRALVRSITTAALRRFGLIRLALAQRLERGLPKRAGMLEWILIVGAAQILFLDVPDRAAVDLAVRAVRLDKNAASFAGLTNAVLRGIARDRDDILAQADALRDETPGWLAARWAQAYGLDRASAIASAHRHEPSIDLTVKADPDLWAQRLSGRALPNGSVRLETHAPIPELDGYDQGEWWVQDAAASLPARLLHVQPDERVADLCAAPGGKTAQLAALGADVTAVDRSAQRLKRLATNLERLGLTTHVVVDDAQNLQADPFDAVLLDAPCSATGTIRRHPDVAWVRTIGDITKLAALQSRLLDKAVSLLKPNGRLVYCTCSLEPEEGENQIAALLRRNPDVVREPIDPAEIGGWAQCLTPDGDLRTLPCHLPDPEPRFAGLDGFFASRLRRKG